MNDTETRSPAPARGSAPAAPATGRGLLGRLPSAPWRDRSGRLSWLRVVILVLLVAPGLAAAVTLATAEAPPGFGTLAAAEARPIADAIRTVGDWAVRFLLLSLAITPAMRLFRQPRLLGVRRMIGVGAFSYAAVHLCLYVADQSFDLAKVASEIVLRIYLTIGFVALLGLSALAATSTDGMVRRLGSNWQRLHRIVYPIAVLALLHFFMQSKIDVSQPVLLTGFFIWLMGARMFLRRGWTGGPGLFALAVLAAAATALVEAGWYAAATGVPPGRVLAANLGFALGPRPAVWVFIAGVVAALAVAVARRARREPPARRSAASA